MDKTKQRLYKIGVWEEQGGYVWIEAKTRVEAKKVAIGLLDEYGITHIPQEFAVEVTHRETELV